MGKCCDYSRHDSLSSHVVLQLSAALISDHQKQLYNEALGGQCRSDGPLPVAAQDAEVFGGDDVLEITHASDAQELAEVEQTLRILLDGVGTLVV